MKQTSLNKRQQGLTLIEILISITIIVIFVGVVVPRVMDKPDQARIARAKQDIRSIETALDLYRLDNFSYPSTEQGLEALVSQPSGDPPANNWKQGGYLKSLPKDPWDRPYQFLSPGSQGEIDVFTYGADGRPGGEGPNADVGNWTNQ